MKPKLQKARRPGTIIVVSGPSGVGKTSICRRIIGQRPDIWYSISATSRPRRPGERHGREYYFLSRRQFLNRIKRGAFAEWAVVHGHYYGTPLIDLRQRLQSGQHVLLDVDIQGGRHLKKIYPHGVFIFIRPPSYRELKRRLVQRNTEDEKTMRTRLARAWKEIRGRREYGHTVINDNLARTVKRILRIIERETAP